MSSVLDIDRQIDELQKQRAELTKAGTWRPKAASEYTPEEKATAFDKLHEMALDHYTAAKTTGTTPKDSEHYMFEAVMELLGPRVWDSYNKFLT